jgi:hypothetical protein
LSDETRSDLPSAENAWPAGPGRPKLVVAKNSAALCRGMSAGGATAATSESVDCPHADTSAILDRASKLAIVLFTVIPPIWMSAV